MKRLLYFPVVWGLAIVVLAGCKPESEPDWPYGAAPVALPDVVGEVSPSPAAPSLPAGGAPDVVDATAVGHDVSAMDSAPAEAGDAPEQSEVAAPVTLSEELLVALRRPVSAAEREDAQRETRRGRELMDAMRPDAAIERFSRALETMPTHVEANLLAARAYALLGDRRSALRHLLVLKTIASEAAGEALQAARRQPDLRPLHADSMFRSLTGFGAVGIAVRRGAGSRKAVRRIQNGLIAAVEDAGLGAARREPPKVNLGSGSLVLYRPGMVDLANEVRGALGDSVEVREVGFVLADDALVLWAPNDQLPQSAQPDLDALLELRLQARDDAGLHFFQLRKMGFFESEDRSPEGDRVVRRKGRYTREGAVLLLHFEESVETLSEHSDLPTIEKRQAELRLPIEIGPGERLVLDGRVFEAPRVLDSLP